MSDFHGALESWLDLVCVRQVNWTLRLTRSEAGAVLRMGPAAHHLTAAVERHLGMLPALLTVTAAVELHLFRSRHTRPG